MNAGRHLSKLKLLAVWGVFLLLHFSYETFPNVLFRVIGEDGETTFFHMKMLFFAYVFVTLAELALRRSKVGPVLDFLASRALVAVAFPWLTITLWFGAEALGFKMPSLTAELVYANVVTAIGIYVGLRLEEAFDAASLRPSLRSLALLLFVAAALSYVAFSFKEPMPFFTTPPGF